MIQTEHQITKAEIMCSVQKRMLTWKKQYSYYSSSKYVFILLHLFVFFVLYEEKLARLFLYNLKHRPNDLAHILRLPNNISDEKYDYPTRDQVILKCNINDSAFVISQVSPLRWYLIISVNWNIPFGFADMIKYKCSNLHFRCTICCWSQFVQFTRWKQEKYLKTSTRPNL